MKEANLIDSLASLLNAQERWMIKDDEGNLHELNDGIKGTPVLISAKNEIYNLYFGKQRIGASELRMMDEVHSALVKFIWENLSYAVKVESQDELSSVIEKYGLKKINKRAKKTK